MSERPGEAALPAAAVWEEIRRRIEALGREVPAAEDLAATWRRRALELAADVGRGGDRDDALQVVVVRLGAARYGIRITSLVEIQKVGRLTVVPGAPAHVAGVMNQRGAVLTVIDLRPVLGLEPAPLGGRGRILVAEGGGLTVGLLVEEVEEIVAIARERVRPPLGAGKGAVEDHVAGIVALEGQMVVLVDLERALRSPRLLVDETV